MPRMWIKVDYENNGEEWWTALYERMAANDRVPVCLPELRANGDEWEIDAVDAPHIRRFFESLPGWNDGPPHAPHPVLFSSTH